MLMEDALRLDKFNIQCQKSNLNIALLASDICSWTIQFSYHDDSLSLSNLP